MTAWSLKMSRLEANSRVITHHKMTIDTRLRTQSISNADKNKCISPIPSINDLGKLIIEKIGFSHHYQNGDLTLTLQDANFFTTDKEKKRTTHFGLLINIVDKNGSITVIKNTHTKQRVEVTPKHKEGEGYEISSHIAIDLHGKQHAHDAVIVSIPKISNNIIRLFIDKILFEIARTYPEKFECETLTHIISPSTKKPMKVYYKPIIELEGKLDPELFSNMSKGGLSEVVLVKNEFNTINAPDVHQAIIPKESTLKITPNYGKQNVFDWLKNLGGFFNNEDNGGYEFIKVKFKEPETGTLRTVSLTTRDIGLAALEKTFIKKTVLTGFSSRLKDSYDNIHIETLGKMINDI